MCVVWVVVDFFDEVGVREWSGGGIVGSGYWNVGWVVGIGLCGEW